jgi:hypothetical protein
MKGLSRLPLRLALVIAFGAICGAFGFSNAQAGAQPGILRVGQMPNLPQPYAMRDWARVTHDYVNFVFDFNQTGTYLPLVSWLDTNHTMVSFPSYVGGPVAPEAVNYLAAVISGSLVGVDMRDYRGHDWLALGTNFFNPQEGVYVNRPNSSTGDSFWYDILPNVLFYQINNLYPGNSVRDQQTRAVAQKWFEACVALGGKTDPTALPNFNHTGLNLKTMQPVSHGSNTSHG